MKTNPPQSDSLGGLTQSLPDDYAYSSAIIFLHGYSLLKMNKFDEAHRQLRTLGGAENAFLQERNSHLLLLAGIGRLPKGKKATMRSLEKIVADPDHGYYQQAKELASSF